MPRELTDKEALEVMDKESDNPEFVLAAKGALAAGYVKAFMDEKGEVTFQLTEQGKKDVEGWINKRDLE